MPATFPTLQSLDVPPEHSGSHLYLAIVTEPGEFPRVFRTPRTLREVEDWCYLQGFTFVAYGPLELIETNPDIPEEWLPAPTGETGGGDIWSN